MQYEYEYEVFRSGGPYVGLHHSRTVCKPSRVDLRHFRLFSPIKTLCTGEHAVKTKTKRCDDESLALFPGNGWFVLSSQISRSHVSSITPRDDMAQSGMRNWSPRRDFLKKVWTWCQENGKTALRHESTIWKSVSTIKCQPFLFFSCTFSSSENV